MGNWAAPIGEAEQTVPARFMEVAKVLYAFNVSRQSFISLGVTVADTPIARLRGLLGRMKLRSDEGIWVVPSRGIHTIGLMFPVDVIYLDSAHRVVHLIENLGPFRIAPLRFQCASVLELPAGAIFGSGTQVGDQLRLGAPEEMQEYWASPEANVPISKVR
jgi:uncharacterized membrane protein (UPF0127 family)